MKEKFSLKDAAFNQDNITALANRIQQHYPSFDKEQFLTSIFQTLYDLELKERSNLIIDTLKIHLPKEFDEALSILLASKIDEITVMEVTGFDGFIMMPLTGYISRYGLEYFDLSTRALYEMTKCFTAEFDIRFFIEKYPDQMFELLSQWAKDPNVHVRRLVSEGTRPRLPWAFQLKAFIKDPTYVIALLTLLKDDCELYVRRSVANNLNDISKEHPQIVIETLKSWQNGSKEMAWITKHALRTLVKAADPRALELLGYSSEIKLESSLRLSTTELNIGDTLAFEVCLKNKDTEAADLLIDYIVWYQKKSGKRTPKVFKLLQKKIAPGSIIELKKEHKFRDLTTRKHHAGVHEIALQINGKVCRKETFRLKN